MNGLRRNSRNVQCRKYQQAGSQAIRLEVRERWQEAARAWRRAAHMDPRADQQQFALQKAEYCQRRGHYMNDCVAEVLILTTTMLNGNKNGEDEKGMVISATEVFIGGYPGKDYL